MAKLLVLKATTDVTVYVKILDSSSTVGAGLTGLVYNSASLVCYYVRPLGSATALTLATQTVTGAHSDGGFVEVSSANMPGIYRLDLSDAICATGVNSVVVQLKGATNMVPVELEIQLTSFDPNDAVRMGQTALPNAAAEASGGLYTRGTGAGQINQPANGLIDVNTLRWNGTAVAAPATAGIPDVNVKNVNNVAATAVTTVNANLGTTQPVNFTGTGASALAKADMVDVAGAAVSTSTAQLGVNVVNLGGSAQSTTDLKDFADDGYDPATNKVQGVVLTDTVTTYTGNTLQTGDSFARLGAPAGVSVSADIAAIEAQTDDIGTAGAGLTNIPWNASWDTEVESEVTDALNAYDPPTRAELTSDTNNILSAISTTASYIDTEITTILNRIGAFTGSGVNTILGFFQALMRKDTTTPSDLGGNYDDATDSLEAIRDRGDAAWITATGFSTLAQADIRTAVGLGSANLDTQLTPLSTGVTVTTNNDKTGYSLSGTQTFNVTGNITGNLSGSVGSVTGAVGSVTGNVTGSIGSLAAQAKADVNAEVVDALSVDTYAEPGQEAPPATTTLTKKIGYLYKASRNRKTQTATTLSLYADNGTTVDQKATISDDGTVYTHGELEAGP